MDPLSPSLQPNSKLSRSGPWLARREELLRDIDASRQQAINGSDAFLIIINIADTKAYYEIIRIFGFRFTENLFDLRLENLAKITGHMRCYEVSFWSIALLYKPNNDEIASAFFDSLVGHFAQPIICRGIPLSIKAGIGVCDLKSGSGTTEDLLQSTFVAGQLSSSSSQGWVICDKNSDQEHRRAFLLLADLGHAISAENEFQLLFQPRLDLKSMRCIGVEALLRWNHPQYGLVRPDDFIPLLEMAGKMREVTDWVVSRAVTQAMAWQRKGVYIKMSINISVQNLDEQDFARRLEAMVRVAGLEPNYVQLEISESREFVNFDAARARLLELRHLGIGVAIDDFGTGPNSFAYLRMVPSDAMKIDQSLIFSMRDNLKGQMIVKSIIQLARNLNLQTVAEGVEDQKTLALLASWGCDQAQGYYFSRPIYADEFENLYADYFAQT